MSMNISEMIQYDKENRAELAHAYKAYLDAWSQLIDADGSLTLATMGNMPSVKLLSCKIDDKDWTYGIETTDIFHYYYVLNFDLSAVLQLDGRYCIFFTAYSMDRQHPFYIYEYVDEPTYKSVYINITEKSIEMPDHP